MKLALAAALALVAVLPAQGLAAGDRGSHRTLPLKGVLVPGTSLAGVKLGDPEQRVRELWGSHYRLCDWCRVKTWFFTYDDPDSLGAAVSFVKGRAVAVFTLGAPAGWRSVHGLRLGDGAEKIDSVYGSELRWTMCAGYVAMTIQSRAGTVTSIYNDGQSVYGFALTLSSQPVCQ
jgi:hypothetical protein